MSGIESYAAPRSLEQAADLLRGGKVTIFAGGTDLMPQTKAGRVQFAPILMNIRHVPELRGISETGGLVRIGALTTMTELLDSDLVRGRLNILWQACDHFASDQLRNASTLGGNICNASPAGDTLVPLLVLDAHVVLASSPDGRVSMRTMSLADFLVGPGRTKRSPDELLATIEIPSSPAGFIGAFFKFGARPALDIATVSIGVGAVPKNGCLRGVRVGFGAVAPTPIRAPNTESAIEGKPLDEATIEAAVTAAEAEIHPLDDLRASDWYRRELIGNMLRRTLRHVASR